MIPLPKRNNNRQEIARETRLNLENRLKIEKKEVLLVHGVRPPDNRFNHLMKNSWPTMSNWRMRISSMTTSRYTKISSMTYSQYTRASSMTTKRPTNPSSMTSSSCTKIQCTRSNRYMKISRMTNTMTKESNTSKGWNSKYRRPVNIQ